MKISIKTEFDGLNYISYSENVPGCYVQSDNEQDVVNEIKRALLLLKRNCEDRNQPLPSGRDKPVFDKRIRFDKISTKTLITFFNQNNYHMEYIDDKSVILMRSDFPFNRVHLPVQEEVSPLIVKRLFGPNNIVYVGRQKINLKASVS